MKRLDTKTISKLAKKLRKKTEYIRQQISKKAGRNNIGAEAQLVLWAREEKIGCQNYYNQLTPDIKQQISSFRSPTVINSSNRIGRKVAKKGNRVFQIGTSSYSPTITLITNKMITEAYENANLYGALYLFENSLRSFINLVMEKNYGPKWWDTKVNTNVKGRVQSREQKEAMNLWHGKRGKVNPLNYTDLADLSTIIKNQTQCFSSFFTNVTGGLNWLTQKLDEIYHSRNNIAHSSPLSKTDSARFSIYFRDWHNQLSVIEPML